MKKQVALGLIGPTLDSGKSEKRWEKWRPTIALCQNGDLMINRLELLYQKKHARLLNQLVQDIRVMSPETEVKTHLINFSNPWDFEAVYTALHDFTRYFQFDPENEEYLVHITTGTHVAQICLFLLTESRRIPGKLIQTIPPSDGDKAAKKSYSIIDLGDLSKYDQIAIRFEKERDYNRSFLKSGIDTLSSTYNRLIEKIERVAKKSCEPMLITGPTGSGKSKLARLIYDLKKDRHVIEGEFVELNCATLRGDAAMSALFGHVKNAYTGAKTYRKGLLVEADKGMVFLDEIGELGLDEQAMLLRAIEEKTFLPLGADKEIKSNFQLICGTNRDLQVRVANGTFREDLLARINLWTFAMPGLKDRPEDIEPNLEVELRRFYEKYNERVIFNKDAHERFLSFATSKDALWKANFRDLGGAVTRMAMLSTDGIIRVTDVNAEISHLKGQWTPPMKEITADYVGKIFGDRAASFDRFERVQLNDVLSVCVNAASLSEAGRILFSESRKNKAKSNDADRLKKYLDKFSLSWDLIKK